MSRWITGGAPPSAVANVERIDADLALLKVPVRPHRLVLDDVAVGVRTSIVGGKPEHLPKLFRPRARCEHELFADLDPSPRSVTTAVTDIV